MRDEASQIERIAAKVQAVCGHGSRLGLHTDTDEKGKIDPEKSYWTVNTGPIADRKVVQVARLDLVEKYLDSLQ